MDREHAETIGLRALDWIQSSDDLRSVFMGSSGAGADALSQATTDPTILTAVLDFILMDDAWVIAFCDSVGVRYTDVSVARSALPGGNDTHWT